MALKSSSEIIELFLKFKDRTVHNNYELMITL